MLLAGMVHSFLLLSGFLLGGNKSVHFFSCWWPSGCFQFGTITDHTAVSVYTGVFALTWERSVWTARHVRVPISLKFPEGLCITSPHRWMRPPRPRPSHAFGLSHFGCSNRCMVVSHPGSNLHFLSTNEVENTSVCLSATYLSSLLKCLLRSFANYLLGYLGGIFNWVLRVVYLFEIAVRC